MNKSKVPDFCRKTFLLLVRCLLGTRERFDFNIKLNDVFNFYNMFGCSISYGFTTPRQTIHFLLALYSRFAVIYYFLNPDIRQSYNQLYRGLSYKPISQLMWMFTLSLLDMICLMILVWPYFGVQLAHLLQRHQASKKDYYWVATAMRVTTIVPLLSFMLSKQSIIFFRSPNWTMLPRLLLTYQSYFIFFGHVMLVCELSGRVYGNVVEKLRDFRGEVQRCPGPLPRASLLHIVRRLREMGTTLKRFNTILEYPFFALSLLFILVSINCINNWFMPSPLRIKLFLSSLYLFLNGIVLIVVDGSSRIVVEFDRLHVALLDKLMADRYDSLNKATSTMDQFKAEEEMESKRSGSTSLYDAIQVYELRTLRPMFKHRSAFRLFTIDWKNFAIISAFVVNYSVLLVQTSI